MTYQTFPADPPPDDASEADIRANLVSRTHSGKRQVRSLGKQGFVWKYTYGELSRHEFRPFQGFFAAREGIFDPFYLVPPAGLSSRSEGSGNGIAQPAAAGGRAVNGAGFGASHLVAKSGDFILFAGHTKVYRLTSDATSNGAGVVQFSISPALLKPVAAGEQITLDNVPFLVAYLSDSSEVAFKPGVYGSFAPAFEEVLP